MKSSPISSMALWSRRFRIVDLTPDNGELIDQAALLLLDAFRKRSESWQDLESARQEVIESLAPDRISRVLVDDSGIARGRVELIGRLDDLITNSGFLVAPFVGAISTRIEYILSQSEVAEVFEVPIDALLAIDQPEVRYVQFRDRSYPAYFYRYDRYEIWGLTGRMLKAFLDLVWLTV